MSKKCILHAVTTEKNISPFDVNMALDAGWDVVMPYTNVLLVDVRALVQDAIFSRSPSAAKQSGLFIGGREMFTALAMLDSAKKAMTPPFAMSVLADPSGSFTTASGMMAVAQKCLKEDHSVPSWKHINVLVAGGTGPVGMAVAALAAEEGANVTLLSRNRVRAEKSAARCRELLKNNDGMSLKSGDDNTKNELLPTTHVVFSAAAAGMQVISKKAIGEAKELLVAIDVNAVPPSGIAGVEAAHNRVRLPDSNGKARGIGALTVGNIKYRAQHDLLKLMRSSDKPLFLSYQHAYAQAQEHAG